MNRNSRSSATQNIRYMSSSIFSLKQTRCSLTSDVWQFPFCVSPFVVYIFVCVACLGLHKIYLTFHFTNMADSGWSLRVGEVMRRSGKEWQAMAERPAGAKASEDIAAIHCFCWIAFRKTSIEGGLRSCFSGASIPSCISVWQTIVFWKANWLLSYFRCLVVPLLCPAIHLWFIYFSVCTKRTTV